MKMPEEKQVKSLGRLEKLEKERKLELEEKTATKTFGRFVAQPFDRGYGNTIGNSLRRILLSSIEGAAITSVTIKEEDCFRSPLLFALNTLQFLSTSGPFLQRGSGCVRSSRDNRDAPHRRESPSHSRCSGTPPVRSQWQAPSFRRVCRIPPPRSTR